MLPFISFAVGIYLPDYNGSDLEVASSARRVIEGLGSCFIICFLLTNFPAMIIFIIVVLVAVAIIILVIPVLCVAVCFKQIQWPCDTTLVL